MEGASRRPVVRMRHAAGDRCELLAGRPGNAWNRLQKRPGIGVLGLVKDCVHRRALDHLAEIHHHHLVRSFGDDAEVMGDEHHRHPVARLQIPKQLQDLRLRRDVESGGRLVGDEQARPSGERRGDHGALAQSAAQLKGVSVDAPFRVRHADLTQEIDADPARLRSRYVAVETDRLDELNADRVDRAEGRHRLLKDQRDLTTADFPHCLAVRVEGSKVDPLARAILTRAEAEPYLATDDPAGAIEDSQDRARGHRFAAAAFADDPERLARMDIETDAVQRDHRAFVEHEVGMKIAHGEKRH